MFRLWRDVCNPVLLPYVQIRENNSGWTSLNKMLQFNWINWVKLNLFIFGKNKDLPCHIQLTLHLLPLEVLSQKSALISPHDSSYLEDETMTCCLDRREIKMTCELSVDGHLDYKCTNIRAATVRKTVSHDKTSSNVNDINNDNMTW